MDSCQVKHPDVPFIPAGRRPFLARRCQADARGRRGGTWQSCHGDEQIPRWRFRQGSARFP